MTRNDDSGATERECIAGLSERTASASIIDSRCTMHTVHSSCPYILRPWYKKECTEGVHRRSADYK
jgi:hypothetical protein